MASSFQPLHDVQYGSSAFQPFENFDLQPKDSWLPPLALNVQRVASWRAMHWNRTDSLVLQQRLLTSHLMEPPRNSLKSTTKLDAHLLLRYYCINLQSLH